MLIDLLLPTHQGQLWSHQEEEPALQFYCLMKILLCAHTAPPFWWHNKANFSNLECLEKSHTNLDSSPLTIWCLMHAPTKVNIQNLWHDKCWKFSKVAPLRLNKDLSEAKVELSANPHLIFDMQLRLPRLYFGD
jgi:hypothetical protein